MRKMHRSWLSTDEVKNGDYIVDEALGVARLRNDPTNMIYFLCDKEALEKAAEDKREPEPQTDMHKKAMAPKMVEVNLNGEITKMTLADFRVRFKDWKVSPPPGDEKADPD
jgi:hypothetical protein